MRYVLAVVLIAAVAIGVYVYRHDAASSQVKNATLGIADDMALFEPERAEVRILISRYHEQAFNKALDIVKDSGHKFDADAYLGEIFTLITAICGKTGVVQSPTRSTPKRARSRSRSVSTIAREADREGVRMIFQPSEESFWPGGPSFCLCRTVRTFAGRSMALPPDVGEPMTSGRQSRQVSYLDHALRTNLGGSPCGQSFRRGVGVQLRVERSGTRW